MPSVIVPATTRKPGSNGPARRSRRRDPELEIVVVVNGSSDQTAEIARGVDPAIEVIETATRQDQRPQPRRGRLQSFRVFLDADIVFIPARWSILDACDDDHPIVSPRPVFDLDGCGVGMRLFMQANHDHCRWPRRPEGPMLRPVGVRTRPLGRLPRRRGRRWIRPWALPAGRALDCRHGNHRGPPRDLRSMVTVGPGFVAGGSNWRAPRTWATTSRRSGALKRMLVRPWTGPPSPSTDGCGSRNAASRSAGRQRRDRLGPRRLRPDGLNETDPGPGTPRGSRRTFVAGRLGLPRRRRELRQTHRMALALQRDPAVGITSPFLCCMMAFASGSRGSSCGRSYRRTSSPFT